jgi:hypothetical protein
MPSDLVVFDVSPHRTTQAYEAAFDEFLAAREAWSEGHAGAVLAPYVVNGPRPFDANRFRKSRGAS